MSLIELAPSGREYVRYEPGSLKRVARRYDRVSDILDTGLPMWEGINEQTLEERAQLGTEVHRVCYELSKSLEPAELASSYPEPLRSYATAWLSYQSASGFKPFLLEEPLASETYGVAGTPDAIGEDVAGPVVIDYTIGSAGKRKKLQTAIYERLWREAFGDRRRSRRIEVHLQPNGRYLYRPHQDPNDIHAFLGLLQFHRWLKG